MKQHYEVVVETPTRQLTVNVFTDSNDKTVIRELAIDEAIKLQKELEIEFNLNEIRPTGYKLIKPFEK